MNTIINKLAAPEPGVGASRGRCGMSVGTLLLAVLLFARGALQADDEKLATLKAGSEVFSNVTITAVSATDIYFTHSRGLGNAKLKTLEPGLQKKFHFDPVKAVEKEQLQRRNCGKVPPLAPMRMISGNKIAPNQ